MGDTLRCPYCDIEQDIDRVYPVLEDGSYFGVTSIFCGYCDKEIVFEYSFNLSIDDVKGGE